MATEKKGRVRSLLDPWKRGLPNEYIENLTIILVVSVGGIAGAWVGGGLGAILFAIVVVPAFYVLTRLHAPRH